MKKEVNVARFSSIELLRIVAMLLIVSYHVIFHLDIDMLSVDVMSNKIFINFLMFNGKLGVNLFMLISGYFLINSKFKLKNIIKLFINATICSVAILVLLSFLSYPIGILDYIKNLFPVFFNVYWFISTYFVIYLFVDYINNFLLNLSKKKYFFLLIMLSIILSVLPSFFNMDIIGENNFLWLLFMYFVGAYIKLYFSTQKSCLKYIFIGLSFYIMAVLSSFVFQYLGNTYPIFLEHQFYFSKQYSIFLLVASIFIFLGFQTIKIKTNSKINIIASCMIGVYLIHDNYLLREYLYLHLFQNNLYFNSSQFIFRILVTILIVFVVSIGITMIYKYTIGKYIDKLSDIIKMKIKNMKIMKKIYIKINKAFFLEEIK